MPSPGENGRSRELGEALLRVEQADRRLAHSAKLGYRRARSAVFARAIVAGAGAVLLGALAGSGRRRRLGSYALGLALPFLASTIAEAITHLRLPDKLENKNATNGVEVSSAPAGGVPF